MKIIEWIKDLFDRVVSTFKNIIEQVFSLSKKRLINMFWEVAMTIVADLQNTNFTNEQKRTEAMRKLETYAKEVGIVIKENMLRILIEMAVSAVKEKTDGTT